MPTARAGQPLRFQQVRFTAPEGVLGPLLLTQIVYECDTLVPSFLKQCTSNQHGHAAAIFPKILLLVWLNTPGCLQFCHGAFVAHAPFGRRQTGPPHPSLAAEVLFEKDGVKVSRATLRRWMVEDGLWLSRKQRRRFY